jgi:hypothetical protein
MWKIAGASVPGTLHVASGRPCEDASGWFCADGLTCLVVADGAGSRPLSGQGSALAVQSVLAAAQAGRHGSGDPVAWVRAILQEVHAALRELAARQGRALGDYATTLAVVLLTEEVACAGQIGDSIVVVRHDGAYQTVAPAPRGEYVNETTFVTDGQGVADARITVLPAGTLDAVFLATDGLRFKILADLAAMAPFPPFFDDLSAYLRSPDASADAIGSFLSGLTGDQTGDDKTLVAAVRGPGVPVVGAPAATSAMEDQ